MKKKNIISIFVLIASSCSQEEKVSLIQETRQIWR